MYLFCNGLFAAKAGSKAAPSRDLPSLISGLFACFENESDQDGWEGANATEEDADLRVSREGIGLGTTASKNQDVIRRFTWVVASINVHLEELRYFWAKALGISGPQWLILMALVDLDQDDGVPVNAVSKKLHVDSSFVTTQSKLLEKKGFLRRRTSTEDARIVKMSLTDKTYKHLSSLDSQREALNEFIFAELKDKQISDLTETLQSLEGRLEKAILKIVADA
jgi:MarR family transcriptional regulator, organic hydroperoxide resistance regulator